MNLGAAAARYRHDGQDHHEHEDDTNDDRRGLIHPEERRPRLTLAGPVAASTSSRPSMAKAAPLFMRSMTSFLSS